MKNGLSRRDFIQTAASAPFAAATLSACATNPAVTAPAARSADEDVFIEELLARMTLEEKAGQLTQLNARSTPNNPGGADPNLDDIRRGRVGSFLGISGAEPTRRLQRVAVEESRLKIPLLFADDVIHGYRTIFPVPLGEAATFDEQAVEDSARVAATEAAAHGLHWTFAPMVDIARDPRWGRIVEGAGEDPFLGARMAAARVRGFQGKDLRAVDTVMATAKHFVAYGAVEGGRDYNTVDVSARALLETYFPPFQAAVDAGVQSVMAAFNEVDAVPMHANAELLRKTLRGRWGFDGIVVSDYDGIQELVTHGVARDAAAAAVLAMQAGVDVDMNSGIYRDQLPQRVAAGRLSSAQVDEAVRRVLRAKYRLGLFSDPYRYSDVARQRDKTLTAVHRRRARDVASKSVVLLKNDGNLLPLAPSTRTIAVIGSFADDREAMLGSWASEGRAEDVVTPLAGIRAVAPAGTRVVYAPGSGDGGVDAAIDAARSADVALLFIGEPKDMTGEAKSRSSLDLLPEQQALVDQVCRVQKRLAVVLFTGRPLAIGKLVQAVPAVLLAWYPGVEAGHALADVLFGRFNPAGRLPVTFPSNVGQVPLYYNHKNTGRPPKADEVNTSKYIDAPYTPLFPFGHGLSYTRFEYRDLRLSSRTIAPNGRLAVTVGVVNVGLRSGETVVQLYLRDDVASVTRPVRQLCGFRRIMLRDGERRDVTFELDAAQLRLFRQDLVSAVEPGTFTVFVGGDSLANLAAQFEVVA